MTPKQKKAVEMLRNEQVAWPPLFEVKGNAVVLVRVLSYGTGHGKLPTDIEVDAVHVDERGEHRIIHEGRYRLEDS